MQEGSCSLNAVSQTQEYPAWRNRVTKEQNRMVWQMPVKTQKILCVVLDEAHELQVEKTMETLAQGPQTFYG